MREGGALKDLRFIAQLIDGTTGQKRNVPRNASIEERNDNLSPKKPVLTIGSIEKVRLIY